MLTLGTGLVSTLLVRSEAWHSTGKAALPPVSQLTSTQEGLRGVRTQMGKRGNRKTKRKQNEKNTCLMRVFFFFSLCIFSVYVFLYFISSVSPSL